MTPAEARALIAEGRAHDEAMDKAPWTADPCEPPSGSTTVRSAVCTCTGIRPSADFCPSCNFVADWVPERNAAGIAWMRTNLSALLDGYTEEMEECRRLREVVLRQSGVLTEEQIAACMEVP